MKNRIVPIIIAFIIASAFPSCQKTAWQTEGEYFHFKNGEAVMPVWVQGNIESGIFILTCHGGPGGGTSGWEFPISPGFKLLEEKYAFVYWDQRISGSSQGDAKVEDLTVDLHIEDLEKLVQIIKKNYNQYILDWMEENPNPVENDWQPYAYVGSMNGYAYDWETTSELYPTPYKELIMASPFSFAFYFTQYFDIPWMNGYDVTEEVSNIDIPALLLWGKEDGAVPASVADFTYSLLETPIEDKKIVLIDECAHAPHYDQPEKFDIHITDFIEKYK